MKSFVRLFLMVLGVLAFAAAPAQANRVKNATIGFFIGYNGWSDRGDVTGVCNPLYWHLQDVYKYAGYRTPPIRGGTSLFVQVLDRTYGQLYILPNSIGLSGTRRYKLLVDKLPPFMKDFAWHRGFLVATWRQISPYIWDKQLKKTLGNEPWTYLSPEGKNLDDCFYDCKVEACDPTVGTARECLNHYDP